MKRTIKILFCITVVVAASPVNGQQLAFQNFEKVSAVKITITKSSENKSALTFPPTSAWKAGYLQLNNQFIPPDNYTRNFGFFCKEELQLQKRSGVNFSLRLGTLDQCNLLEGKTRTIISR